MTLKRFSPRPVAVCASLGLVALTACGSGTSSSAEAADDDVATLQTDDESADSGAADDQSTSLTADEAALEFSQCLRDEGLDVADIGVDSNGNIDIRSAFDNIEPGGGNFREAIQECSDILGDIGFGGGGRGGDFDDTALQDSFLEFSDCIRDQGFEDVADLSFQAPGRGRFGGGQGGDGEPPADFSRPGPGEGERPDGFGDRSSIFADGLGLDPDDPDVIAAIEECSPIIEQTFGNNARPGAPGEEG